MNTLLAEMQEAQEEDATEVDAAEGQYIDKQGNNQPLYSSMSSYAVVSRDANSLAPTLS